MWLHTIHNRLISFKDTPQVQRFSLPQIEVSIVGTSHDEFPILTEEVCFLYVGFRIAMSNEPQRVVFCSVSPTLQEKKCYQND